MVKIVWLPHLTSGFKSFSPLQLDIDTPGWPLASITALVGQKWNNIREFGEVYTHTATEAW